MTARRWLAVLLVLLGRITSAEAQTYWLMPPVPPLAPIGLPLPPLGLQTVNTGQQPVTGSGHPVTGSGHPVTGSGHPVTRPPQWSVPGQSAVAPRGDWRGGRGPVVGISPTLLVFVPYVMPVLVELPERSTLKTHAPKAPRAVVGTLALEIEAGDGLQVFVDGYFLGSTTEVGTSIELEAGQHQIELRASGYEPLAFGVSIRPDRMTTYRDVMKRPAGAQNETAANSPAAAAAAASTSVSAPMPLYVIPGCYAGNAPPSDSATLPSGCKRDRLTKVAR